MPRRARPRVERAQSTLGTERIEPIREAAYEAVPALAEYLKNNIGTDVEARRMVMGLVEQDISRARAGDQDELLLRLRDMRKAGSPILERYWAQVYSRMYPKADAST